MSNKDKISDKISDAEKLVILENTFPSTTNPDINDKRLVKNVGDFISGNFAKIDGFDFRWSSLITSNPLLFEDIEYLRIKPFINDTITDQEIEAYKRGDLRELYGTFENMLVCNLKYYDRIMSFCTMVFLQYVRVNDQQISNELFDIVMLEMTPTQVWCCALSSTFSTEWELNYAWGRGKNITSKPIKDSKKSIIEVSWKRLYNNKIFSLFVEYSSLRLGTEGFRNTYFNDITSNNKLASVCAKFTKTSTAISEQQLETIFEYYSNSNVITDELYTILNKCLSDMFAGDENQYAVYIFNNEFYIQTSKFSMKVARDSKGVISKDYIANSHECFVAEGHLVDSIRTQIKWSKHSLDNKYDYDKEILQTLLLTMLEENFRDIICIKRMNEFGILSKITFKGMFANVTIIEEFMMNGKVIKTNQKTYSKKNASKFIIERGYVIFGRGEDIFDLKHDLNRLELMNHYLNYCVPVMQHMSDIITLHHIYKNDIIDFVAHNRLNPNKIKNHKIMETNLKTNTTSRDLLNDIKNISNTNNRGSYWKAIEDGQ